MSRPRHTAGDVLRVVDVEGRQVADLVACPAADLGERLSQGFTRMLNGTTAVGGPGTVLYSDLGTPLLEVVHDPLGMHDLVVGISACAADMGPRNGGLCTGLRLVLNPEGTSA